MGDAADGAYLTEAFRGADMLGGLQQGGFPRPIAELLVEWHAVNRGMVRAHQPRDAENTMPTTFEMFADVLAASYRAM